MPVLTKDNHGGLSLRISSPVASNPHSSIGFDPQPPVWVVEKVPRIDFRLRARF